MRDNVKTRAAQLEKFEIVMKVKVYLHVISPNFSNWAGSIAEIWRRNHNADTLSLQFKISLIEQLFLSENN